MSKKGSPMGAILALTEAIGLGFIGVDHLLMSHEAAVQGSTEISAQHFSFAVTKFLLLLGALVIYYVLRKMLNVSHSDPLYVFPLLILIAWLVWSIHDMLWVVMGSVLEYKYILNVNTDTWKPYNGFTKFMVLVILLLVSIITWHFLWYFDGQK